MSYTKDVRDKVKYNVCAPKKIVELFYLIRKKNIDKMGIFCIWIEKSSFGVYNLF